ncbi:MAG: hypothetical protein M1814_000814 [Vezdaea aestivalis]|nr:MAG: hypothetical protein M1814_000814 [Vezdaea aestivalis]
MAGRIPKFNVGDPELIVVLKPQYRFALLQDVGLVSHVAAAEATPIQDILNNYNASLNLLFGHDEQRLRTQQVSATATASTLGLANVVANSPDLSAFYNVQAPVDKLEELATSLNALSQVEAAYVKPAGSPPILLEAIPSLPPSSSGPPAATPNYISRQGYLGAAPAGIEAITFAHDRVGGQGERVRVIDCEWGWRFTHEDLSENQGGVLAGTQSTDVDFVNHGTAVAGEISGDRNDYGVTGIVPRAIFSASSFVGQSSSTAIKFAADKLGPGDVLLLEIHRAGPNSPNPLPPNSQQGFIAIEWWYDDFAAIRYAVSKGVIVVEAAGNGYQNLDDPIYNTVPAGSPAGFKNPFNPANPSSGAILVGAGAPPPGTSGGDWGPDRSRLDFSNYGARVDAQGWGRGVVTTGYGDLQTAASQDLWYTQRFSGTSSASPIVTGALAAVSGILKDFGRPPLTPEQAKKLLRSTGSPQQDGPNGPASQRIGNRPNLKELIPAALQLPR